MRRLSRSGARRSGGRRRRPRSPARPRAHRARRRQLPRALVRAHPARAARRLGRVQVERDRERRSRKRPQVDAGRCRAPCEASASCSPSIPAGACAASPSRRRSRPRALSPASATRASRSRLSRSTRSRTVAMPLTVDAFTIQEGLASRPRRAPRRISTTAPRRRSTSSARRTCRAASWSCSPTEPTSAATPALAEVAAAAREAHVRIYTVGLQLAGVRSGRADHDGRVRRRHLLRGQLAADLNAIYSTLSAELSNAYLVRYESVAEPRGAGRRPGGRSRRRIRDGRRTRPRDWPWRPRRRRTARLELAGRRRGRRDR